MIAELSRPLYAIVTFTIVFLLLLGGWRLFKPLAFQQWLEDEGEWSRPRWAYIWAYVVTGIVGVWFITQGFSIVGSRTTSVGADYGVEQRLNEAAAQPTVTHATATAIPVDEREQQNADENQSVKDRFKELAP